LLILFKAVASYTPSTLKPLAHPVFALLLCNFAIFATEEATARGNEADRPNLLIIVSDDQGYGDLAAHGNPLIQTPYLDQLHGESTRLDNFYTSPVCAPTRASLMTGRYPYRTGVWDTWKGRQNMRESEITLAEVLRDADYRTGLFGKWHLGENAPLRPQDQGFQETFLWTDTSTRFDPGFHLNGEPVRLEGFQDDLIFDQAIRFIEENENRPFFCYVASFLPHDFPGKKQIPEEEVEAYSDLDHLTQGDRESYAMVTRMDRNIGRLLASLNRLGLNESTIVVFLSDNGPRQKHARDAGEVSERYNAGLRGAKGSVYEGGIRTPCFFRWPDRITAGRDIKERTAVIDLFPTALSLLDIPLPTADKIDGINLAPILLGEESRLPDRTLFHQFQRAAVPDLWTNSSATGPRYKMVNGTELYDLIEDPGETTDLAAEKPMELSRLRGKFEDWFKDVSTDPGFVGSRVWIGSEVQPEVRFKYWHATDENLLLSDVRAAGHYDIRITGLQPELVGDDSTFLFLANGKPIAEGHPVPGATELMIPGIYLPVGPVDLSVELTNPKTERRLSYGEADPGYRFLYVTGPVQQESETP